MLHPRLIAAAVIVAIALTIAPGAHGAIASVGGNAVVIPRPVDDRKGALVSDTEAFVWAEAQNIDLPNELAIDLNAPGTYKLNDLSTSYIAAGTPINSYYFSFDAPGDDTATGSGSVTFNTRIIGVIARNSPDTHLDDSNYLGLGTLFTTGELYSGLDGNEPISVSPDRYTFSYDLSVTTPGDHFRIITIIPEPTSVCALALLVPMLRRRR